MGIEFLRRFHLPHRFGSTSSLRQGIGGFDPHGGLSGKPPDNPGEQRQGTVEVFRFEKLRGTILIPGYLETKETHSPQRARREADGLAFQSRRETEDGETNFS